MTASRKSQPFLAHLGMISIAVRSLWSDEISRSHFYRPEISRNLQISSGKHTKSYWIAGPVESSWIYPVKKTVDLSSSLCDSSLTRPGISSISCISALFPPKVDHCWWLTHLPQPEKSWSEWKSVGMMNLTQLLLESHIKVHGSKPPAMPFQTSRWTNILS